jgi:hypothetical protein
VLIADTSYKEEMRNLKTIVEKTQLVLKSMDSSSGELSLSQINLQAYLNKSILVCKSLGKYLDIKDHDKRLLWAIRLPLCKTTKNKKKWTHKAVFHSTKQPKDNKDTKLIGCNF